MTYFPMSMWSRAAWRRASLGWGAALLMAAATPTAWAQEEEPAETSFGMFEVHSVLVASFEADQPFLDAEATRVSGLVREALGQSYVVLGMEEVPAFPDYGADVYLRSCPDGQSVSYTHLTLPTKA